MYMWPLTAQQQRRSHGDDGALRSAQVRQLAKVVHGVLEEERHLNIGQLSQTEQSMTLLHERWEGEIASRVVQQYTACKVRSSTRCVITT